MQAYLISKDPKKTRGEWPNLTLRDPRYAINVMKMKGPTDNTADAMHRALSRVPSLAGTDMVFVMDFEFKTLLKDEATQGQFFTTKYDGDVYLNIPIEVREEPPVVIYSPLGYSVSKNGWHGGREF